MTDDSHAARNAAMLRHAEAEHSRAVVRAHNNLVAAIDGAAAGVETALLDGDSAEAFEGALDELEAVAESLRDHDRLLERHELLLASPERDSR